MNKHANGSSKIVQKQRRQPSYSVNDDGSLHFYLCGGGGRAVLTIWVS